jgi:aromatic-amino-acid transaminase
MISESRRPGVRDTDVFEKLTPQPEDSLLGLINLYRADNRNGKIDLGVGVYKNDEGNTPVMRAVKAAEAVLLTKQDSKSYLGADGDRLFADLLAEIVFGGEISRRDRLVGVQTPGGTGALRLGAESSRLSSPDF